MGTERRFGGETMNPDKVALCLWSAFGVLARNDERVPPALAGLLGIRFDSGLSNNEFRYVVDQRGARFEIKPAVSNDVGSYLRDDGGNVMLLIEKPFFSPAGIIHLPPLQYGHQPECIIAVNNGSNYPWEANAFMFVGDYQMVADRTGQPLLYAQFVRSNQRHTVALWPNSYNYDVAAKVWYSYSPDNSERSSVPFIRLTLMQLRQNFREHYYPILSILAYGTKLGGVIKDIEEQGGTN